MLPLQASEATNQPQVHNAYRIPLQAGTHNGWVAPLQREPTACAGGLQSTSGNAAPSFGISRVPPPHCHPGAPQLIPARAHRYAPQLTPAPCHQHQSQLLCFPLLGPNLALAAPHPADLGPPPVLHTLHMPHTVQNDAVSSCGFAGMNTFLYHWLSIANAPHFRQTRPDRCRHDTWIIPSHT